MKIMINELPETNDLPSGGEFIVPVYESGIPKRTIRISKIAKRIRDIVLSGDDIAMYFEKDGSIRFTRIRNENKI